MSTIPTSRPSRGSRTGAAAQVQLCRARMKCSAEWTWMGARAASAVPIAFVPVAPSAQAAPSSRQMSCARWSTPELPWRHSTRPSTSVTTMICCAASAMDASPARSSGITSPRAVLCRRCSISSASSSSLSGDCSGSIPLRTTRSQEASISARGATGDRSPVSLASLARWSSRVARSASWPITRTAPAELVRLMVPTRSPETL